MSTREAARRLAHELAAKHEREGNQGLADALRREIIADARREAACNG